MEKKYRLQLTLSCVFTSVILAFGLVILSRKNASSFENDDLFGNIESLNYLNFTRNLYLEMSRKVFGKDTTYDELYLEVEETDSYLPQDIYSETLDDGNVIYPGYSDPGILAGAAQNSRLNRDQDRLADVDRFNKISNYLTYSILDLDTGKSYGNTAPMFEDAKVLPEVLEYLNGAYLCYYVFEYDANGELANCFGVLNGNVTESGNVRLGDGHILQFDIDYVDKGRLIHHSETLSSPRNVVAFYGYTAQNVAALSDPAVAMSVFGGTGFWRHFLQIRDNVNILLAIALGLLLILSQIFGVMSIRKRLKPGGQATQATSGHTGEPGGRATQATAGHIGETGGEATRVSDGHTGETGGRAMRVSDGHTGAPGGRANFESGATRHPQSIPPIGDPEPRRLFPLEAGLALAVIMVAVLFQYLPEPIARSVNAIGAYMLASDYPWLGSIVPQVQKNLWLLTGLGLSAVFCVLFTISASFSDLWVKGVGRFVCTRVLAVHVVVCVWEICRAVISRALFNPLETKVRKRLLILVTAQFAVLLGIGLGAFIVAEFMGDDSAAFFYTVALLLYSVVLYFCAKAYVLKVKEQYECVLARNIAISQGDISPAVPEHSIFASLAETQPKIAEGVRAAVEKEMTGQRLRNELITNVSHDLKTPLTAISIYAELLNKPALPEEERLSYAQTLCQKTERLKILIEDLFEVSKANSGDTSLNLEEVDLVSLVKHTAAELSDRLGACGVIFRYDLPDYKVIRKLDGAKAARIFENLFINITKYAMKGTRAYVSLSEENGKVTVTFKNISEAEPGIPAQELTERFVRGDKARHEEGSGLGLAIADSFAKLMGGKLELRTDGDLFVAGLQF